MSANRDQGKRVAPTGLGAVLDSLPDAVMLMTGTGAVAYANMAAENFFAMSAAALQRLTIDEIGSPILALVEQVRRDGVTVSEYEVELALPRLPPRLVDIQASPVIDQPGQIIVIIHERSIAQKIERQLSHRGAARSVGGLAMVLAHEIKNPLSGIRGAAQILEQGVEARDRELTGLICHEVDRICALVDRMEAFSDQRPLKRQAVNIHQALAHVKRLAASGFARNIRFSETYDPSLPPALGDKDQLIQVFLNLIKNAAEAILPGSGGEITLTTAYRHGVSLADNTQNGRRVHLPLEICVIDSGPGVPAAIQDHLFEPFMTTKSQGSGLGLALVAKIVGDHGGMIDCVSAPGRTVFRLLLPAFVGELER